MALIVEDGTGLSNADSYQSLTAADSYAANFGLTAWSSLAASPGIDDTQKEVALRNATLNIDISRIYIGVKLNDDQSLEFPRSPEDEIGMPQRVRDCAVILADLHVQGIDLNEVAELIREISVGVGKSAVVESKKYDSPLLVSSTQKAYNLLRDYIESDPNDGVSTATICRS